MSDLQDIRKMTVYALANLAAPAGPDSADSPGASFLDGVRTYFLERFDYAIGEHNGTPTADDIRRAIDVIKDEAASEIADSAVPVYTYQRWQTFTDLAAWEEDVDELGDADQGMTALAGVALYLIAERLVIALAESLDEWADDVEANEDDADSPAARLEYLRTELRAERISYEELAELQSLAEHIDPSDTELLEAAGVPEHTTED